MEPDRKAVSSTENPLRELLKGTLRSWIVESGSSRRRQFRMRALSG